MKRFGKKMKESFEGSGKVKRKTRYKDEISEAVPDRRKV